MNQSVISPYIRTAMHSTLLAPVSINKRVLFDYEIILVNGGKCYITIDGIRYLCQKNDVVLLRPGVPHDFEGLEGVDFMQPHIHFDLCYSNQSEKTPISFQPKETMSDYELSLIQKDILPSDIPPVFIPRNLPVFQKLFFEIITLYQKQAQNYILLYKAKMIELLNEILLQFEAKTLPASLANKNVVIAIKDYIDSNYLSDISLTSLATQFHLNPYTMMRKFKSRYQENVITYYRKKRVAYAKEMLSETKYSISDISELLNFSDIYSFSRFFKQNTGLSPTDYRKNNGV